MSILIWLTEVGRLTLRVGGTIPGLWFWSAWKGGNHWIQAFITLCFSLLLFKIFIYLICLCLINLWGVCACMYMHEHTCVCVVVRRRPSGVLFCHSLFFWSRVSPWASLCYDLSNGHHKDTPWDRSHMGGLLWGIQRSLWAPGQMKKRGNRGETGLLKGHTMLMLGERRRVCDSCQQ